MYSQFIFLPFGGKTGNVGKAPQMKETWIIATSKPFKFQKLDSFGFAF